MERQLIYQNNYKNYLPLNIINDFLSYRKNVGSPFVDSLIPPKGSNIFNIMHKQPYIVNKDILNVVKKSFELFYGGN